MSEREFRLTYGYGIATTFIEGEVNSALAAELAEEEARGRAPLSDSEQLAYNVALYGPAEPGYDPKADGAFVPAQLNAGCVGSTSLQLATIVPVDADGLPTVVARALSEIGVGLEEAAPVQPTVTAWSECMAAAGYAASNRTEAMEIVHSFFGGAFEVLGEVTVDATTTDGRTIAVTIPAFDTAKVDEGSELELRVARADQACDDESGMSAAIASERHRRRSEFVKEYEGLLTELPGGSDVTG